MFKLLFVIAVFGFACAIPVADDKNDNAANPAAEAVALAGASSGGSWPQMPQFKIPEFPKFDFNFPEIPKFDPNTIANMKPAPGQTLSAVSISTNSKTEWKDGKPVVKNEGSYTINKNGVVESGTFPEKQTSK